MRPLKPHSKKSFFRWRMLLLPLFLLFVWWIWIYSQITWNVIVPERVEVLPWDTMTVFQSEMWFFDRFSVKRALAKHTFSPENLEIGTYRFEKTSLNAEELLDIIVQWPWSEYTTITVLEWWSIYDTDDALAKKWLITAWDYIAAASEVEKRTVAFSFLGDMLPLWRQTLEGYLYPDTYFVDAEKNVLDQLLTLQLRAFKEKIYDDLFLTHDMAKKLILTHTNVDLTLDEILILSSVIEKEEKTDANKATIAGLFLNRLDIWMRLGADVTLCYWLYMPYADCTVPVIIKNLKDTSNPYNTRALTWLPPTPIANPEAKTVQSVLEYIDTDYVFYLHDPKWQIYYGETNADHERNKSLYL